MKDQELFAETLNQYMAWRVAQTHEKFDGPYCFQSGFLLDDCDKINTSLKKLLKLTQEQGESEPLQELSSAFSIDREVISSRVMKKIGDLSISELNKYPITNPPPMSFSEAFDLTKDKICHQISTQFSENRNIVDNSLSLSSIRKDSHRAEQPIYIEQESSSALPKKAIKTYPFQTAKQQYISQVI